MPSKNHASLLCPDELPTFVRRCRYRNPRTTSLSEKLRTTVRCTTSVQEELCTLFEITHSVVSYEPWPGPVTVRAGWSEPFEYWPSMAMSSASGILTFVDVVYPDDEDERERMEFKAALTTALRKDNIDLVTVAPHRIAREGNMRIAKAVRCYSGFPYLNFYTEFRRSLRAKGGSLSLGDLAETEGSGQSLVATACVLVMRRELKLAIDPKGFATSKVVLADGDSR